MFFNYVHFRNKHNKSSVWEILRSKGDFVELSSAATISTIATTTTATSLTTTPAYNSGLHHNYDEGTLHLAVVICGLVVFVGVLCSVNSMVSFIKSKHQRRQQSINSGVRPGSSFFQRFSDDPPAYPGKYSRTNINYLPSYESAIKIANELDQTACGCEAAEVAETDSESQEVKDDCSVIMFTVPGDFNASSEQFPQSAGMGNSNENSVGTQTGSCAVNLVDNNSLETNTTDRSNYTENTRCDFRNEPCDCV